MNKKKTTGANKAVSAKRVLLIVLCAVLALILVTLVAGVAYMESVMGLINREVNSETISSSAYEELRQDQTETMDPNFTGEIIDPDDVEWNIHEGPVVNKEHIINIMLIGQDRRPNEGRCRSDVMILCTVNINTQELTMTSFMRDLYVPIPGYGDDKMNAAYQVGGMETLDKCLESNFGIHVDGNIEVDFEGFVDLIDLVGGIDIELSQSEANHLIAKGFTAKAGMNHLNGEAALAHARNRSVGDGDFTRTERQRNVIGAMVQKCKDMNLTKLKKLMESALPMLTTDMSNREILNYLLDVLPILSNLKINNQRIPADGTYQYAWIRDMSVLLPDLEANRKIISATITE